MLELELELSGNNRIFFLRPNTYIPRLTSPSSSTPIQENPIKKKRKKEKKVNTDSNKLQAEEKPWKGKRE
jgi:hypothetical protein